MKKILIVILLMILTGCKKYVTCTIDLKNESMDYELNAKYKIYYSDKYVTKIVKEEKYITDVKDTYKYLSESKELEYSMLNNAYGGYDYEISKNRNNIKIKTVIDLKQLDVEKMVSDKIIDKYYTSKDEILLSGIKKYYESKSAICK